MRSLKKTAALLAIASVLGAGALAGCSDSDSSEASTPSDATTAQNTAAQTTVQGDSTVTSTLGETTAEETTAEETDGGGEEGGDVAAGQATFQGVCQGCHPNGGQEAGVGPQLAGGGRAEDLIRTTVQNGKGAMPGGLVSGEDLDNVTAYVLSIQ